MVFKVEIRDSLRRDGPVADFLFHNAQERREEIRYHAINIQAENHRLLTLSEKLNIVNNYRALDSTSVGF
ncbi:MAG: hypothetical protein A2W73_10350 [Deltaproteobacteria bacterium RIFCSPLOWO2_12_55_13]|nr:MAG: hypothetical protein A2W73_10350 [Deltaproteobacteria bacterium RIFCSPLOWO2_12_55_13]